MMCACTPPPRGAATRAVGPNSSSSPVEPTGIWCGESASFAITVANFGSKPLPILIVPAEPFAWGGGISLRSPDLVPDKGWVGRVRFEDGCETNSSDYCFGDTVAARLPPGLSVHFIASLDGLTLREGPALVRISYRSSRGAPSQNQSFRILLVPTPSRKRCFLVQALGLVSN